MTAPKPFLDLQRLLERRGFRVEAQEHWGAPEGVRQFIQYEQAGLHIAIGFDREWGIDLAAKPGLVDSLDIYPAAAWALWLGRPLRNPDSLDDQAHFVSSSLDDLSAQVSKFDRRAMSAILKARA